MRLAKESLSELLGRVRNCRLCETQLPLEPKPILRATVTSKILIIGQAPGARVHHTGIPWNDPSGDRLRQWMSVDRESFYDATRIAIIPMGFCYPGKGQSGDLPPRKECAEHWHRPLLAALPALQLTLLVGSYAQRHYLSQSGFALGLTLAETVRNWRSHAPTYLPLPHPSPRNIRWLKNNPWFEEEVVPALRHRLKTILR